MISVWTQVKITDSQVEHNVHVEIVLFFSETFLAFSNCRFPQGCICASFGVVSAIYAATFTALRDIFFDSFIKYKQNKTVFL